jgi:hypothetical protein
MCMEENIIKIKKDLEENTEDFIYMLE